MAITTNGLQLARISGAVFNQQLSSNDYSEILAANKTAAELDAWANVAVAAEFRNKTTTDIAKAVLANVGLTSVAGLEAWVAGQLNAGGGLAKAGSTLLAMLNDYSNMSTTDATYGASVVTFNAKSATSQALSQTAGTSTGTFAAVSAVAPAKAFTLTTGVDTSFVGGSGNDSFVGSVIDTLGTGTTFNPGDSLSGGDGTDSLILTMTGNPTASTYVMQSSSVEEIRLGNYDSDVTTDATLDLSATTGITRVETTGGNGDTLFTGLRAPVTIAGSNATGEISVTYASSVLSGTTDVQNVSLTSFGLTGDRPTLTVADAGSSANIAETLAFNVTGSNFIALNGANNTKTITVTGTGSLAINTGGETTITKIDASGATGAVQILDIGASNLTMTGGAGNDVLRIDGSTINSSDSVNAGEGTDILQLTAATNVTAASAGAALAGFESVLGQRTEAFADSGAAATTVAQLISLLGSSTVGTVGTNSFALSQTAGGGDGDDETIAYGVNFTGLAAGTNMALSGMSVTDASTTTTDDGLIINFTATARLATDTTNDAITVTLGTATASATSTATQSGGTQDSNTAFNVILDLDNYETVSLVSQGGANTISNVNSAVNLKTLNVNAVEALTVSAGTWGLLTTIDASASVKNVNIAATSRASTITGGGGNDTLTGSSLADSISGGVGNDSLTGGGANDTIDGGAGNDIIITSGTNNDVVTGGDGDDSITGATGNDNLNGGAGNDQFTIDVSDAAPPVIDLSSADTVVGGDGTDTLLLSGTHAAARTLDLSGPSETRLAGVSGVENITIGIATSALTLTLGDISLGSFGGSVGINIATGNTVAHNVNVAAVLNSSSKVTFTGNSAANIYTVGNNIDSVNMSSGDDTIRFTNLLFLQATDSINGGTGTDSLSLDTGVSTTVGHARLGALTSVETITVVSDDATTDAMVIGLSDAVVNANKNVSTDTLTIVVTDSGNNGTLTINATPSAAATGSTFQPVTAGKLHVTGGQGADTVTGGSLADSLFGVAGADSLSGGAGNDTIDGGAGIDSVIGGDGTDTVQQSVVTSNGRDIITGFVAGAVTSGGEVFHLGSAIGGANATLLSGSNNFASAAAIETLGASATAAAATEIVRFTAFTLSNNLATTTTANDLDGTNLIAAVTALTVAADQNKILILIGDQFGNTGIYYAAESNDGGAALAAGDIALIGVLSGVNVSSLTFNNFSNGALFT
jgi:Ca2+-binding RTX toxin-like protein